MSFYYQYSITAGKLYIVRYNIESGLVEDWNIQRKNWREDSNLIRYFSGDDDSLTPVNEKDVEKLINASDNPSELLKISKSL